MYTWLSVLNHMEFTFPHLIWTLTSHLSIIATRMFTALDVSYNIIFFKSQVNITELIKSLLGKTVWCAFFSFLFRAQSDMKSSSYLPPVSYWYLSRNKFSCFYVFLSHERWRLVMQLKISVFFLFGFQWLHPPHDFNIRFTFTFTKKDGLT